MNMKLTTLFAVISMVSGVAMAQPAGTTGSAMMAGQRQEGAARPDRGQMGGAQSGPFAKLQAAKNLPSITPEQTQALDAFMEQRTGQAMTIRDEMRTAMQQAKDAPDRQARQAIMQPLRQKVEAAQLEVDTLLKSTLTPEQLTEVNAEAADMMKKAARDRVQNADGMTSGAMSDKAGKPGKPGKKGEKGKKAGKDGKRFDRENTPANNDASTTGTGAANPFVEE